ncbi:MAG: hypothetical protein Q4E87_03360 [bacterium]|nr:hypothetical protein [bacterium]
MSLLSKFYHRRYMRKTLEQRAKNAENNVEENIDNTRRSLLSTDETYESANSGFFASAGEVIEQGNNNNNGNFFI